jgi:hypothetical protein
MAGAANGSHRARRFSCPMCSLYQQLDRWLEAAGLPLVVEMMMTGESSAHVGMATPLHLNPCYQF